jgi:beta-glucosidase
MNEGKPELKAVDFPPNFVWGAATAAYQIEGAAKADGRGPSIWDVFSHTPGKTANGDNGDVACDHYYRYKDDVALMHNIGLNGYRFSISWPRIQPVGKGQINQAGLDFYTRLVDELLEQGIQPFATLFHWDLPQALQEVGGWSNRDTTAYFAEYADIVSRHLGDRVKGWITLNEPAVITALGHLTGEHAPGLHDLRASVRSAHHQLLAHGLAMPILRQNSRRSDAEFGITLSFNYVEAGDANSQNLATIKDAWENCMFLDPLFKSKYPEALAEIINEYLPIEGNDMAIISTPVDFLGVNYYFRSLPVAWLNQSELTFKSRLNPGADYTAMGWEIYPDGLYKLLVRFHEEYKPAKLYITENGMANNDVVETDPTTGKPVVHDPMRLKYLQDHFGAALQASREGVPVAGYFVWSLLDNFEWAAGYDKRFGVIYVDYQTQQRILKDSGVWYRDFLHSHRQD